MARHLALRRIGYHQYGTASHIFPNLAQGSTKIRPTPPQGAGLIGATAV